MKLIKCSLLSVVLITIAIQTNAQWSTNSTINNAVCTATGAQAESKSISDNAGGVIVTWTDFRSGTADIYAQRMDAGGAPLWGTNGVIICNATGSQSAPTIVSDNAGGAIVAWEDARSVASIYAQRVNGSGVVQWTANGVLIASGSYNRRNPVITSSVNGESFIVWEDSRAGTGSEYDIYGQLVNASGIVQWTANGVVITAAVGDQFRPSVTRVIGSGSVFVVAWQDYRSSNLPDIYAQRINSAGLVLWTTNGISICSSTGGQFYPSIVSDDAGLASSFIVWEDYRGAAADIYAQRIDAFGVAQWTTDGVPVCNATGNQINHYMIRDGNEAAIVWQDSRSGNADIYAQKLNQSGVVWGANGIAVSTATGNQSRPQLVNASDGYLIAWDDERTGPDVYAQRINDNGVPQWTANGVAIANASNNQVVQSIVGDFFWPGFPSAIVSFLDSRSGSPDIYAQRINFDGVLCGRLGSQGAMSGNVNIAAGLQATYSITSMVGATNYEWTLPSGWSGTSTTNSITVTPNGASGTLSVQASNACGLSSASTSLAITVSKQNQTITFAPLAAKTFGDANFNLAATASSTLTVSYVSSNTNVATISGSTVTIVGAGTTTITASQAGNEIFNAAANVPRDLVVNKGNQTITFNSLPAKTLGDAAFTLGATASSGLTVSYTSSNMAIATVAGNTVTLVGAGSVTIHANQAGDNNYNAATQVSQTFCVNPPKPVITVTGVNTESPTLTSNASSGNQWFRNDAVISGATATTLSITQPGVYKVQTTVSGCTSAFSDPQTFVITAETSSGSEIEIFPNPVTNRLLVRLPGAGPQMISIYAADGRRMDYQESDKSEIEFNTSGYAAGFYIIRITSSRVNFSSRFTKE